MIRRFPSHRQLRGEVKELRRRLAEAEAALQAAQEDEAITQRKRAERQTHALADLGRELSAASTPRAAGLAITRAADQFFTWDACVLLSYSAVNDTARDILVVDLIDGQRVEQPINENDTPPTQCTRKVLTKGAQLVLRAADFPSPFPLQPFGELEHASASLMFVPVRHGAETVGVLSFQSYKPNAYDEHAIEALQGLADHCGGALHRLEAERALRESEEKHRVLFDCSKDAFMHLAPPDWRFTTANPATLALFGAKNTQEFLACAPWQLSPERQPDGQLSSVKAKEMIATAMREGSHFFDWTHRRLNGPKARSLQVSSPSAQDFFHSAASPRCGSARRAEFHQEHGAEIARRGNSLPCGPWPCTT